MPASINPRTPSPPLMEVRSGQKLATQIQGGLFFMRLVRYARRAREAVSQVSTWQAETRL